MRDGRHYLRYAKLEAVAAVSSHDVWAVGEYGTVPFSVTRTLIEHWNGRRWTIVRSPNVSSARGAINDILFAISGSRSDDVWAVGSWGTTGGYGGRGDHALALHWNGRVWSLVRTPPITERSVLTGVATRDGQAWAVGNRGESHTLIEHWNERRWTIVPSPDGRWLSAIATGRSGALLAVGASGPNGSRPLAARC
jgi:hypothetical protein